MLAGSMRKNTRLEMAVMTNCGRTMKTLWMPRMRPALSAVLGAAGLGVIGEEGSDRIDGAVSSEWRRITVVSRSNVSFASSEGRGLDPGICSRDSACG